jgi:hypothetical protein
MPPELKWATSPTAIDASGKVPPQVGPELRGTVADTLALAAQLNRDDVRRRVAFSGARHLTLYLMGRDAALDNSCLLEDVQEQFYRTGSFPSFFRSLLTSPGFQSRDPGH